MLILKLPSVWTWIFIIVTTITHVAGAALALQYVNFSFFNFDSAADIVILGNTVVNNDGSVSMTYNNTNGEMGPYFISRMFYKSPIMMHNASHGIAVSFSTSFEFTIIRNKSDLYTGDGFTFFIGPSNTIPNVQSAAGAFMGLFDSLAYSDTNSEALHLVAVEYDTFQNSAYNDPDNHHVGLDINSIISIETQSLPPELILTSTNSSHRFISWIDYDALQQQLDVYVALSPAEKASAKRMISYSNLSIWDFVLGTSYVGFSASTGLFNERHTIYSWNFSSRMVSIPIPSSPVNTHKNRRRRQKLLVSIIPSVLLILSLVAIRLVKNRLGLKGLVIDLDITAGMQRFTYGELSKATGGFKEILGQGGSGTVFKGTITTNAGVQHVAVKRISKASKTGEKEFKSEVLTIGRLRHKNIVHLYGWCNERDEFLLVYQYMTNGSLYKHLYNEGSMHVLSWDLRFSILKGIAAALVYLHVDSEKRIIHRDIKASNVMLDSELTGRLGDFGLARCFDHDRCPTEWKETAVAGTLGYIAPEYAMSGRVTVETDIYSFGVLALEIACGKRPFVYAEESLVEYIWAAHEAGHLMQVADDRLNGNFSQDQMKCVLHLGLLCTHPDPRSRLQTASILQMLSNVEIPLLPMSRPQAVFVQVATGKVYRDGILTSRPSSTGSVANSILSDAR